MNPLNEKLSDARKVLLERYDNLQEKHNVVIDQRRAFRQSIFIASLTALALITPFAKEYVVRPDWYFVAYYSLFIVLILGVLMTEVEYRVQIKLVDRGVARMEEAIEHFYNNEPSKGMAVMEKERKLEDVSVWIFILGAASSWILSACILLFVVALGILAVSLTPV
jgi:hypothetical protein